MLAIDSQPASQPLTLIVLVRRRIDLGSHLALLDLTLMCRPAASHSCHDALQLHAQLQLQGNGHRHQR